MANRSTAVKAGFALGLLLIFFFVFNGYNESVLSLSGEQVNSVSGSRGVMKNNPDGSSPDGKIENILNFSGRTDNGDNSSGAAGLSAPAVVAYTDHAGYQTVRIPGMVNRNAGVPAGDISEIAVYNMLGIKIVSSSAGADTEVNFDSRHRVFFLHVTYKKGGVHIQKLVNLK